MVDVPSRMTLFRATADTMGIYYRADVEIVLVPRRSVVRATAADLRSRSSLKAPASRAWDEVTLGALVVEIAATHGYQARVDPSLAESPIAHIDQVAESDLHLLRRVAGHYDAMLNAAAGHLVVVRLGSAPTAGTGVPLRPTRPRRLCAGSGRADLWLDGC